MTTALSDAQTNELLSLAERLRADAWPIAERWTAVAAERIDVAAHDTGELGRFGEVPTFLAALARLFEQLASGELDLDTDADGVLREAAHEHARSRARAGYDQRDMLVEFVALRRVLWEHLNDGTGPRPSVQVERIINLLFDTVIVEAADQFFGQLTEALVRKAEHDPLTDLFNRQAFHERLDAELARAQRYGRELTVVSIDLDAFKQVNDTLGHLAGDALLQRIGTLLATHTRDEDIVGRLGGDEFAVVLVEAGRSAARDLIRRVRIHLAPARRQFGLPREFGVSFGSASFPADGDSVDALLYSADAGMYSMKGPGRGLRDDAPSVTEAGEAPALRKVRVLVADDDAPVRMLCRAALEHEGFEVLEAVDGVDAVERALDAPPDVVLLDVAMPRMDGWDVAERLSSDARTRDVPIVLLTGRDDAEQLERADRAGAVHFVAKPFAPEGLVAALHEALELSLLDADRDLRGSQATGKLDVVAS
jgi:diguanylate cyclase (GGDEF)-like protein